ncbi:enolase C-terminal domain-like protein [Dactylosporangium sp. CA-092794]|uniref:enolase C-terminal domain-like protein n=1 Tax=Dactylosporangium sp. CA-092794 TaxID=3239929 RepID=UPI003D8F40C3
MWRLITAQPTGRHVPAYATCFGMRLDHVRAPQVISEVRQVWPIQKWRPVRTLSRTNGPALRAAQAAGPAAVALDFGGVWPTRSALRYAGALELELAFIEEPAPPGALTELDRHPRPAPVAAGEHCYNVDETAVLLAAGIDVWQPDAVFCGGFTALRAIAARAAKMELPTYPHGGGLIPAIHAAIAGDPIALVEHHLLLEPRRQVHLGSPLLPGLDGQFGVPELPGWAGPLRTDLADG